MDCCAKTLLTKIFTIGVYGSTEDAFFDALVDNKIDLFIDVRARRGLRGATYRFANSQYLQATLEQLGVAYAHLPELAPNKAVRATQQLADQKAKIAKRERVVLSDDFIKAYRRDVLKVYKRKPEHKFYAAQILQRARALAEYPTDKPCRHVALFCVEREPSACHRLLLADEMHKQLGIDVVNILVSRQQICPKC